ncbi:MAG: NAD(P) transhydrogenase subunit alpha [Gammaproteobacteria bacterium RIFCSPLOWO2_02_FULL_42_9]|nr:MAG: NAD(P) transhydrogenase subunit alpha [Gammaproteobacteria bacterium RIFCSPLOWO2_02_FULL_42_9]
MPLTLAVPKETQPGEKRTALVPALIKKFSALGLNIAIESGTSEHIFQKDTDYTDTQIEKDIYAKADILIKVQPPTLEEIDQMKPGAILISFLNPYQQIDLVKKLAAKKITSFGMEMIPRISRAQNMDALSSQASVAGYKGALIAANTLSKLLPMLTTAAGTIRPSKILIIGVGVAGLQAIATAHRLGAIVEAYDVRPETKEQAESLGARFIQIDVTATGTGGYARELTDDEKRKQKAALTKHFVSADAIICTAGVPGKKAPVIITKEILDQMRPGSVIVDLVAELGGNCEVTEPNKIIDYHGITICGPTNVASSLATHASEMYSKNIFNLLQLIVKEGHVQLDWNDEIIAQTAVTHDGKIVNEKIRQITEGKTK